MFVWGWTPFVDPDPMLSYFTCDQVASDPKDPTNYYNDANWCDPQYDALYKQQKVELDPAKREEHRAPDADALPRSRRSTTCSTRTPTRRRTARTASTGFVRQPAEIGPVLFSNTSPTYARLKPVDGDGEQRASGGGGGRRSSRSIVAVVLVVGRRRVRRAAPAHAPTSAE